MARRAMEIVCSILLAIANIVLWPIEQVIGLLGEWADEEWEDDV